MRFLAALLLAALLPLAPAARADDSTRSDDSTRAAIGRALPLLQRSASTFAAQRGCVSCHHNSLTVMTLRMALRHGFGVDASVLDAVEARTFRPLHGETALDEAIQTKGLSDPTPDDSFMLMAAHAAGLPRGLTAAVYARRLAHWQRPDGHWMTSDFRPPHSSSAFTATATAVLALRAYMPTELADERDKAIRHAAAWLARSPPHSTEDAAFRLLGLVWSGAPDETLDEAERALLALQQRNGGWSELPSYAADGYSTGEALYALRLAGMVPAARAWRRGLRFLIAAQARDGSWHVPTRMISPAEVSPPYFSTGFPYGKDEYLSYTGTCWAVMALLSSLPEASSAAAATPPAAASSAEIPVPRWLRTALFGSARALPQELDAGLDPNSSTAHGTTPLMAAVLDPDKVRLLLAHGANPRVRSESGFDALAIAASHVGALASVSALLDAGAEAEPPEGVRVGRAPLVGASLAGDVSTVRRLLRNGSRPSIEALAEAVTFGHAEVVATLIDAGADVTGVEATGINLLHWAAIANRAAVIPLLARAGVPIDAVDDAGFTPLMYAATIDQGDQATLEALLSAGADPSIRNSEGSTALEQAQRLEHEDAARVLRGALAVRQIAPAVGQSP